MKSQYHEHELYEPVDLCDQHGNLNPNAVGFSRHPLHNCNLQRHWLRKKRWNYWAVVSPTHLFSVTLSNVDYLGLPFIYFLDFANQTFAEKTLLKPFGTGCHLPPTVDGDIEYDDPAMKIGMHPTDQGTRLVIDCPDFMGKPLNVDLLVQYPAGHESLNVVIPWSANRFQFTSKQNTLPAGGKLNWGDTLVEFNSEDFCLPGFWARRLAV